jgi:hypothetical protein
MMICSSDCRDEATTVLVTIQQDHICVLSHHFAFTNQTCEFTCEEDADTSSRCLYRTFPFWSFVTFMYVGCIGANVIMSITDAICFDIIGTYAISFFLRTDKPNRQEQMEIMEGKEFGQLWGTE